MSNRDENGRLKLPSTTTIPFQRVQVRSNRGSKNNSRRESPEYGNKSNRSRRQWGSTESKRGSRSQSFNVSELGNSQEEENDGYYYDGDAENNDDKGRRRKSKSRGSEDDVSTRLGDLSLTNGKKARSKSLTEGLENTKMPYIPFQRVLNIRKRATLQDSDSSFKVPAFTALRDRRDFRFRYDSLYRTDGYTSEYRSRFRQRQKNQRARRKAARNKNESHLQELLVEKDFDKNGIKELNSDDEGQNNEENGASKEGSADRGSSSNSQLSAGGSRQSKSSNGHEESGNVSGQEDRPESSTPSVKLPQIQQSPLATGDSARSVKGTGALPPPKNPSLKSAESGSHSHGQLLLAKLQPVDTSHWVEGKGAGRLSHFFQMVKPSEKKQEKKYEPTIQTENSNKNDTVKMKEENSEINDKHLLLPEVNNKKMNIVKDQSFLLTLPNHKAGSNGIRKDRRNTLLRSKSDSALYQADGVDKTNIGKLLKPNQLLIFSDTAVTKSLNKGARPKTALPRIILTMAEGQTSKVPRNTHEKFSHKNIQKGTKPRTRVPSLPDIHTQQNELTESKSVIRPKTSRTQRRKSQSISVEKSKKIEKPIVKHKRQNNKTRVISTLRKPLKSKIKQKTEKHTTKTIHRSSRAKLAMRKSHQVLNEQDHQSKSTSSHASPSKLSITCKRFSKSDEAASYVYHYDSGKPLAIQRDEATSIVQTGSNSRSSTKRHVEDIKNKRKIRLERFSHFLPKGSHAPTGTDVPTGSHTYTERNSSTKTNNHQIQEEKAPSTTSTKTNIFTTPRQTMSEEQEYLNLRNL